MYIIWLEYGEFNKLFWHALSRIPIVLLDLFNLSMIFIILLILGIFPKYWCTPILSRWLVVGCARWRAWPAFWFLAVLNRNIIISYWKKAKMVSGIIRISMYQLSHTCSDSDERGASDIEAIDFDLPSFWSAQSGLS